MLNSDAVPFNSNTAGGPFVIYAFDFRFLLSYSTLLFHTILANAQNN